MNLEMDNEPERNSTPDSCQGHSADEVLTPETRDILGTLALHAQTHSELGEALAETDSMLSSVVERHPEFVGPVAELRAKIAQLQDLHNSAGRRVMRHSHAYEEAIMAGAELNERLP